MLSMILIINFMLQISNIRTVHQQLIDLLSASDKSELAIYRAFDSFKDVSPLQPNPYTEPLWRAACTQYEQSMAGVEKKIASKLRSQFQSHQTNLQQVNYPPLSLINYLAANTIHCLAIPFYRKKCS